MVIPSNLSLAEQISLEKYICDCAKRVVSIGSFSEDVARQMCEDTKDEWWPDFISTLEPLAASSNHPSVGI